VRATANCTVAVYRATEVDDYADTVDDNTTPVLTGIPARITERTQRVTTADDPTPRIVRWHTGRVEAGTDIRADDRLESEQTGVVYLVDSTGTPPAGVLGEDLRLDLRQTA
jgi:hypothetical protein